MTGIIKTDQLQGAQSSTITVPSGNNLTVGGTLAIGGTSTSGLLHLHSSSDAFMFIQSGNSSIAGLILGDTADAAIGGIVYDNNTDKLALRGSNNADRLTIDASGNVGIGTASPSLSTASGSASGLEIKGTVPALNLKESSGNDEFLLYGGATSATIYTVNNLRFLMSGSEKMRLDTSGNVIVGKTATGISNAGHSFKNDGTLEVRRDISSAGSSSVGYISRGSSDGAIITFYKDTTAVGNIQSRASAMLSIVLNPSGSDGAGFTGGSDAVLPANATALSDNAIDLGVGSYRYKDLYLSGGAFIGGTGSANKLDDYEEGTFTPVFTNAPSSGTVNSLSGNYTKIGRLVYIQILVQGSGFAIASYARIQGLPFSAADDSNTGTYIMGSIATRGHGWTSLAAGQTQLYLSTSGTVSSNNQINVSAVYRAS